MAEIAGAGFAGGLSERVRFERRAGGEDGAGGRGDQWELVRERWARVEPVERALTAQVAGDARASARMWRVTVRGRPVVTLDMRMLWRGRRLRLTGISDDPAAADRTVLWAEDMPG